MDDKMFDDSLNLDKPYFSDDVVFSIDGLSADEYIAKITEEMNAINFDSIPFDKWDYIITFVLALLEVAGDLFIADPGVKSSLAHRLSDKNDKLGQWLQSFHTHDSVSPLDYQYSGHGPLGDHRAVGLGHDLPLARLLYGAKENEDDGATMSGAKRAYNGALLAKDLISVSLAIYSISSGKFIDCLYSKSGVYETIISTSTVKGTTYDSCNVFVAIVRYVKHMLADFCSARSLPVPGFSVLTHWPDRDVEAFALKLYRNGMNLRTMALGGAVVGVVELVMRIYVYARYNGSEFSESQQAHKLNKLLLICHGITTSINVGKVVITEAPWRLNLILIARTFNLVWKVLSEELKMTNRAMEKNQMGMIRARVESLNTVVLLDKVMYETANYERLIKALGEKFMRESESGQSEIDKLLNQIDALSADFNLKTNND